MVPAARACQNSSCWGVCGILREGKLPPLSASAAQIAVPNAGSSLSSTKGLFWPSSFTVASPALRLCHWARAACSKLGVNCLLKRKKKYFSEATNSSTLDRWLSAISECPSASTA